MPLDDVVDFYIVLLPFTATRREQWLICAKPASHCLAVHEDKPAAFAHARRMADYRVSAGQQARIHEQDENGSSWKTIWCSIDAKP